MRKIFNHILKAPIGAIQKEYAMKSKHGALGSYKYVNEEVEQILSWYPR